MRPTPIALLLLLVATASGERASDPREAHLFAGVRAFRADRFAEALDQFREVERAGGARQLGLYLGPTLFKLERYPEARAVLAARQRAGPPDGVADYYLALTYHRLGLSRLARLVFASIHGAEAGPRLAEGAARFIAAIDARPPTVDAAVYLAAAEALETSRPDEAFDNAREALLRAAAGSSERARAALLVARLALSLDAAPLALELLGDEATPPPALAVELARAALAVGDRPRARVLLDGARRGGDAATRDAADRIGASVR
ncbi:MAG: hypothetical protein EXR72_14735 [Myxococcales bacterium]|nr:hypothetical protein [Myxococcales bacterium]